MQKSNGAPGPDSYNAAIEFAIGESGSLAMRALAGADHALLKAVAAAGDNHERNLLIEAAEGLRKHRGVIQEQFPDRVQEEMANRPPAEGAEKAISFETLELMGEEQVDDTVEVVRSQQLMRAAVEADLVQLNALVSAAQGHAIVSASHNPLRPETWVRALHAAITATRADPALRALWMRHTSFALGPELAQLYRAMCGRLRQDGVAAASFRVNVADEGPRPASADPAPSSAAAVAGATTATPASSAVASATSPQPQVTLRDLKRLLASVARGDGEPAQTQSPDSGQTMGGMTMPAAMEALQGMKRMDDVVRRMQTRWREGMWQGEARHTADGAAEDYTPTQTLAREVVRLMVANIAADGRLLPEIQQAVRELEPALLRLVIHDQRFFTDRKHPARELLDEMTQRSLAWPRREMQGFDDFFSPLQEVVQSLAGLPLEDADPFEYGLQTLRQTWAELEERTRRKRAAMAKALMKADARNHAAGEMAARLRERPDVSGAPAHVRRFLLGPWCQVMAAAKLASPNEADPGGYAAIVNDLVWSAQPRLASQNPPRLAKLAGPLVETLRRGLAATELPLEDHQHFLDTLAADHAAALRGEAQSAAVPAKAPPAKADGFAQDGLPWLSPQEARDSQLAGEATQPGPGFQPTQAHVTGETAAPAVRADDLKTGQYVEVHVQGAWVRWRLSWASPHGLMFMFTNGAGQAESMTRQMFEKMVSMGALRPVASHSAVDGALDAIASQALQNSTRA